MSSLPQITNITAETNKQQPTTTSLPQSTTTTKPTNKQQQPTNNYVFTTADNQHHC